MQFIELIERRSSVRKFRDKRVPEEALARVLEAARLAPSWANKQCWHFVVVRDPERIEQLAKAAGTVNRWLKNAPLLVVACGDPSRSGSRDHKPYYLVDVAIAMEHLVLAATEEGLGTCWIGYFDEPSLKSQLGIPASIEVVALTPLGHPAEREGLREKVTKALAGSKRRKPLEEIVHDEHW